MKWYDIFSGFYDKSLDKLYFESRSTAAQWLDLQAGQSVMDIACGTGANFEHLFALTQDIQLFGTDYSQGMLNKAKKRVKKQNWANVELFQADAQDLSPQFVEEKLGQAVQFDRIICALGLSVIPNWEKVLDQLLSLLKKGGKIVIMDVFAEKRNINSWLVERLAGADLNRTIWQSLKEKTADFQQAYLPVSKIKVGGSLFVASGVKK